MEILRKETGQHFVNPIEKSDRGSSRWKNWLRSVTYMVFGSIVALEAAVLTAPHLAVVTIPVGMYLGHKLAAHESSSARLRQ